MEFNLSQITDTLLPDKPLKTYSGKELMLATLGLITVGAIAVSIIAAPNLAKLFKAFNARSQNERWRLYQRLKRLEKERYIEKGKGGYVPTTKGRVTLSKALLAATKIPEQRWDGNWHIVLFDLPAKHARARFDISRFLSDLGYIHYQKSVFIHRHNLQKVVEQFCDLYGIRPHLNFITAIKVDNAQWLKTLPTKPRVRSSKNFSHTKPRV